MRLKNRLLLAATFFTFLPVLPADGSSFANNFRSTGTITQEYQLASVASGAENANGQEATDQEETTENPDLSPAALGGIIGGAAALAGGVGAALAYKKNQRFKAAVRAAGNAITSGSRITGRGIAAPFKAVAAQVTRISEITLGKIKALKTQRKSASAESSAENPTPSPAVLTSASTPSSASATTAGDLPSAPTADTKKNAAAIKIQSVFRGFAARKSYPKVVLTHLALIVLA